MIRIFTDLEGHLEFNASTTCFCFGTGRSHIDICIWFIVWIACVYFYVHIHIYIWIACVYIYIYVYIYASRTSFYCFVFQRLHVFDTSMTSLCFSVYLFLPLLPLYGKLVPEIYAFFVSNVSRSSWWGYHLITAITISLFLCVNYNVLVHVHNLVKFMCGGKKILVRVFVGCIVWCDVHVERGRYLQISSLKEFNSLEIMIDLPIGFFPINNIISLWTHLVNFDLLSSLYTLEIHISEIFSRFCADMMIIWIVSEFVSTTVLIYCSAQRQVVLKKRLIWSSFFVRFFKLTPLATSSVLQCVAVCYSVLQCVAVWRSVLQCIAVWCNVFFYEMPLAETPEHKKC